MAFSVRLDAATRRIEVDLVGFASMEDVSRFETDLRVAFDAVARNGPRYQLLYDVSRAAIQSQEVVAALRALAVGSPPVSHFAMVNASALAGRQLRRIFHGIASMECSDRGEAVRWLDAQRVVAHQ